MTVSDFDKAEAAMKELFAKDCVFAFATAKDGKPAVRMLDIYYEDGAFTIVTYASSDKVKELTANENVALCSGACRFTGRARNIGHPLAPENAALRQTLIKVFEPWYFAHNNEDDAAMCYVRVDLQRGFFPKDGLGYSVDFEKGTAEIAPYQGPE